MTDERYDLLPEWARWLLAGWEGYGPWVPDEELNDEGRAIKAAFLEMLVWDTRAIPALRAALAELEGRA